MREMYDALDPAGIPATARMVAGYDSWQQSDWDRFRGASRIRIAQHSTQTGPQYSVLDVERYDATIAEAPGWIKEQQRIGARYNTIYVEKTNLAELWKACKGLHYYVLVAWWTDNERPVHLRDTIGTQFYHQPDNKYDLSAIYESSWHPATRM